MKESSIYLVSSNLALLMAINNDSIWKWAGFIIMFLSWSYAAWKLKAVGE